MLLLDAMEDAPTVYVVLTARELLDRAECRRHLLQLRRSLRKCWPSIRWAVLVEFQRRGALHLNLLVKGVPVDDVEELHRRASSLWCRRVDAEPQAQFVGPVNDGAGLVRYISLHFLKRDQAPPAGWRGHRYSATRDYLVRPAARMREEARRSLRLKRLLHRGVPVELAELELEHQEGQEWLLWGHTSRNPDVERAEQARAPFRWMRPRSRRGGGDRDGSACSTTRLRAGPADGSAREIAGRDLRRGA
jgi:hypothetical protein